MTSKKLIEVFDHSAVNLMVGRALLILSINNFNLSSPCFLKKNMSSLYRHHKYGLYLNSFIISSSSSAINKMLCGGVNFVPESSPPFLLKCLFSECKYVIFKHYFC